MLLAGGQSLVLMLNLRLVHPELLVDISLLDALGCINETDDAWRIRCAVAHAQLDDAGAAIRSAPMIAEVAHHSVCNRSTIKDLLAMPLSPPISN